MDKERQISKLIKEGWKLKVTPTGPVLGKSFINDEGSRKICLMTALEETEFKITIEIISDEDFFGIMRAPDEEIEKFLLTRDQFDVLSEIVENFDDNFYELAQEEEETEVTHNGKPDNIKGELKLFSKSTSTMPLDNLFDFLHDQGLNSIQVSIVVSHIYNLKETQLLGHDDDPNSIIIFDSGENSYRRISKKAKK